MQSVFAGIDSVVNAVSGVLYMPWVPLLLLAAGLFFTCRSKFVQLRLLGESFRVISEKPKTKGKEATAKKAHGLQEQKTAEQATASAAAEPGTLVLRLPRTLQHELVQRMQSEGVSMDELVTYLLMRGMMH